MPDEINGKVLSAYLKSGEPLCGAFQLGRCQLEETDCTGQHRCAVLLKSGRICGGWHTASQCWEKRAFKREKGPSPAPSKGSHKEVAKPSSKATQPHPPEGPPPKKLRIAAGRDPPRLPVTDDVAKVDEYFDYMAGRQRRHDQAPTPIFKSAAGGILWLGPLPTKETQAKFPRITLQVTCFAAEIEERGGIVLPGRVVTGRLSGGCNGL